MDENKLKIVEAGVIPYYVKLLSRNEPEKQEAVAHGLWLLAFMNKGRMIKEEGCKKGCNTIILSIRYFDYIICVQFYLSVEFLFSPLGKLAIYFTFSISRYTGPIFTIFAPNRRYYSEVVKPVQFFRFLTGRYHGNQFCVVPPDLFAQSQSISGSAGPMFKIFAPYGRY